jgi:hypothetical protein
VPRGGRNLQWLARQCLAWWRRGGMVGEMMVKAAASTDERFDGLEARVEEIEHGLAVQDIPS